MKHNSGKETTSIISLL